MGIVPPGGLILITGVNGYIASVTARHFLSAGYRVRGTVRDVSKYHWMLEEFGPGFELAQVPEILTAGAFAEAIRGVEGVVHMAASIDLDPYATAQIEASAAAVEDMLALAAAEPSVKRFVLTSAQLALLHHELGIEYSVGPASWNEVAEAGCERPYDEARDNPVARGYLIYAATKTRTERAAYAWVRQHKPGFVFNSVLPNVNFGTFLRPDRLGFASSMAVFEMFSRGVVNIIAVLASQWYVNVEDTARLHLAALTLDDVQGERLLAMAGRYTWSGILEILKKRFPQQKGLPDAVNEAAVDEGTVDNSRSVEVLRQMGRNGFISLEDTLVTAMETINRAREANADVALSRSAALLQPFDQPAKV